MKHKMLFSFVAALVVSLCTLSAVCVPASAADGEHVVEYSETGIVLPILRLPDGQSYLVEVFADTDENYSSPLSGVEEFVFYPDSVGTYKVRYTVHDNGRESYEYATLKVEDTTAPVISLSLARKYNVGDTLNLRPLITDNTAYAATVSYTLLCNGKQVSVPQNGVLKITEAGEYRGRVSVTDAGGNVSRQNFEFTAEGGNEEEGCGCGGVAGGAASGGATILISATAALCATRRKNKEIM